MFDDMTPAPQDSLTQAPTQVLGDGLTQAATQVLPRVAPAVAVSTAAPVLAKPIAQPTAPQRDPEACNTADRPHSEHMEVRRPATWRHRHMAVFYIG